MSGSGGRPQSVSDEEILQQFKQSRDPVLSTAEVAEAVGVSRRTALRRLSGLADEGAVARKNVGERSAVWWLPDRETDRIDPDEDPFIAAEPFSSGQSDVSESVDEEIAAAAEADE